MSALTGDRPLEVVDARDAVAFGERLLAAVAGEGPALLPRVDERTPAGELPIAGSVAHDIALVIETSGSTGAGKRVALPGTALAASTAAATARLGAGQWLLALPASYIAGVNVLLRSLSSGFPPVVAAAGSFTPDAFLSAAERLDAERRLVSLVPAQLARVLDDPDATTALARFDAVLVGGQSTPQTLRSRAVEAGVRLVRSYGSSETAGGCVYDGVPLDGVLVEIADGEVLVGGATLAAGYLDDDARTASVFVERDGRRWLRTGDLGALDAQGALTVTGRRDDVIVSGGTNVSLGAVERAVRALPGLATAIVVAVPSAEWGEVPVVVSDSGDAADAPDLSRIRRHVAESLGRAAQPARLVRVDAVPQLASGKPDRVAARRLALRSQHVADGA